VSSRQTEPRAANIKQ